MFVMVKYGMCHLVHVNLTTHPNADWTLQQLREIVGDKGDRYVVHDHDRIFLKRLGVSIKALGLEVSRSPVACDKT